MKLRIIPDGGLRSTVPRYSIWDGESIIIFSLERTPYGVLCTSSWYVALETREEGRRAAPLSSGQKVGTSTLHE